MTTVITEATQPNAGVYETSATLMPRRTSALNTSIWNLTDTKLNVKGKKHHIFPCILFKIQQKQFMLYVILWVSNTTTVHLSEVKTVCRIDLLSVILFHFISFFSLLPFPSTIMSTAIFCICMLHCCKACPVIFSLPTLSSIENLWIHISLQKRPL